MTNSAKRLPPELLLIVFSKLESPKDLAACELVCKDWRVTAKDQGLWMTWCAHFWISPPITTDRDHVKERDKEKFAKWTSTISVDVQKNSREIFVGWWRQFREFQSHYPQMKTLMFRLFVWLKSFSASTLMTFVHGRTGADWDSMLKSVGNNLGFDFNSVGGIPEPLKPFLLFYHFWDGQKPRMPHVDAGLYGTYTCYAQYTSLFVYPSRHIKCENIWGIRVAVFAVCPRSGKYLSVVIDAPLNEHLLYHVVEIDDVKGHYLSRGYFLDFFLQYIQDLEDGLFDVVAVDGQLQGAISMFPNSGPYTSSCETNGISIHSSTLFQIEAGSPAGMWAYRIKMEYIGGLGCPRSCQLESRKWIIKYESGFEELVEGDAVVGQHPQLSQSSPTFSFCSICPGRQAIIDDEQENVMPIDFFDPPLWMEGEFTFVPGQLRNPTGEKFRVKVARFHFIRPKLLNRPEGMQMDVLDWD